MYKIRKGTFETNSSSVHSLVMCSGEEYELLQKGKLLLDEDGDLVSREFIDNYGDENNYFTLDEWWDDFYEHFHQAYTTENGEEVVAFGYFGC